MKDDYKTKAQLIKELKELRQHLTNSQPTGNNYNNKNKLLHESDFLNAVIDSLPGIFYLFDDEGRLLRWNKNLEKVTHYTPEELSKLQATAPFLGDDKEKVGKAIQETFKKGKNTLEADLVTKRGTKHPYFFTGLRVTLDRKQCLIGMGIDITKRKQLERELNKSHQELEEKVAQRTSELQKANATLQQTISAYRETEAELIKTKDFTDNIIDSSLDPIVISDPTGYIIRANKSFLQMLDYKKEEVIGKHIVEFQPTEEGIYKATTEEVIELTKESLADSKAKIYNNLFKRGRIELWEFYLFRKDGKLIAAEENIFLLYDKKGEVSGAVGIIRDITEKKRAGKELSKAKYFLESIFKTSADGIIIADLQGTITMVNEALEKVFGYSKVELLGKHTAEMGFDEKKYTVSGKALIKQLMRKGVVSGVERIWKKKDGTSVDIEMNIALLKDSRENVIGSVGSIRDITERKQAEEKLRESETRARALLNVSFDAILLIDNQGTIFDCNEGFSQRFHKTPDELIGSVCWDLYPPELIKSRKELLDKAVQSGETVRFEDQRQGMWLDNVLYPITDKQGTVTTCAIFSRDITDRKRNEEKIIQNQDQLRLLASQLTKSEEEERRKIASYLHDHINQELFVLKLQLEHLKQLPGSRDNNTTLDSIIKKTNQLMTDMRSLTYELSPPILYELGFKAAVEWLVGEIRNTHTITLEDDGQVKLLDEPTTVLLFQAVRELLNNITKHAEARNVKVAIERNDATIVIRVKDDGVGFKNAAVDLLRGKNFGFGLYSIRERLRYLGGDLDIQSEVNRGTQTIIKVPITS